MNRYLVNLLAAAIVKLPSMDQVGPNQYELNVRDLLGVIPHNPAYALAAVDEIQFVFGMKMHREIKIVLDALKDQETVFRAQLGDLSVNFTSH